MKDLNYEELKSISENQAPPNIVDSIGFEKTLYLVHQLLNDKEWDESLHEYGALLLENLRRSYPKEWNSHWKYDAFLGYAYDIIFDCDERYAAYHRAFQKADPPPPELLVALAGCCSCPGKPPINEEKAIHLVKEAIKDTYYVDALIFLRGLYRSAGNHQEEKQWDSVLNHIQKEGKNLPSLDFMNEK